MLAQQTARWAMVLASSMLLAACGSTDVFSGKSDAQAVPPAASVSLAQDAYTVNQGDGSVTVTVTCDSCSAGNITVDYATADGSAVAGSDYTAASGTLSWGAGDDASKTISIPISTAPGFSGIKGFSIMLSNPTGGATLGTNSTTVSIDGAGGASPAGGLTFSASTYSVQQSAHTITINVNRINGSSGAVSVSYATANGTAIAGTDYASASGSLNWADGDTATKSFSVTLGTDGFTGSKNFTIALSTPTGGASLIAPSVAAVTISGSGAPPSQTGALTLSSSVYPVAQDAGSVTVTVSRTGGSSGAASVHYATANGTAVAGSDYTATSGTLNWADGDTADQRFSVSISNATPFDGSRTFIVELSNASGSSLGAQASANVNINGSGTPASTGSLALSAATYSLQQSGGAVQITVTRTGGSSGVASVHYSTTNGTAIAGSDYTTTSGTLSWSSGDAASKTFAVPVSNAAPFTGAKSFTVTLSNVSGSSLGSPASGSVTITGSGAPATPGTLALSAATYSLQQSAGSLLVTVTRTGGSSGAASVHYATANGTAIAGTDYTATTGTVSWSSGDATSKTFSVPVSNATAFTGSKTFTVALSNASGSSLGSVVSATVTISGSGVAAATGSLALSAATYSLQQNAGSVTVTVTRTGGSSGAASAHYATANGTAIAGADYTATTGTVSWSSGDATSKTFSVPVSNATPFTGSKTFTVALSSASGSSLGTPSSSTVTLVGDAASNPTPPTACAKTSSSWTTSGAFDTNLYGNYIVGPDNFNGTPGMQFWASGGGCWGATTSSTTETGGVGSYPHVVRGWSASDADMQQYSDPGTLDWTTKSGMGVPVSQLTKAKVHWAFTAPTAPTARWLGLMDIYLHKTIATTSADFPPFVDVMMDQAIADAVVGSSTYYALVAAGDHASHVTISGVTYLVFIDDSGESGFHQSGGHNIHLLREPTSFTVPSTGPNWGVRDGVTDVAAIIKFFMQSNPLDDSGQPIMNANGDVVTTPLIASNLYLNAINAGWEEDFGTGFATTNFCVAMQSEADCP